MKRLLYYNPKYVKRMLDKNHPGVEKLADYLKIFKSRGVPIDRTGTIVVPFHHASIFPIPTLRPSKSYEEICNDRAIELLRRADALDTTAYVFWSGGIDSTLALISLLKHATLAQKARLAVLLSEESIEENPIFYREHIHGKLKCESSMIFPYLIGRRNLLISGELNDQLFGSEMSNQLMKLCGNDVIHRPYSREPFLNLFSKKIGDVDTALFYIGLFERLKDIAPIPITTNHDIIWWFSFAVNWQSVFMRTLSFASSRTRKNVDKKYVETYYAPFYMTDDFQLWSMNNPDKKIKDTWSTYKWPAKEIIYDFTKDTEYRDTKIKRGSLFSVLDQLIPINFIDESYNFLMEIDPEEYLNPVNDFV